MTNWVIDLDGVMWRGRVPIPGSADAVAILLDLGDRVVFCTNNSAESGAHRAARLVEQGVPEGCEVVTSADAVTALVRAGERVLCLGGPGLMAALSGVGARGARCGRTVDGGRPRSTRWSWGWPATSTTAGSTGTAAAVRAGARFLASNDDATFPGADGIHPGCGSILAAVSTAAGTAAVVAGKPHGPMADLIRSRCPEPGIVVGDKADDRRCTGRAPGWRFGLVLSGVTDRADLPLRRRRLAAPSSPMTWPDRCGWAPGRSGGR